MGSRFSPQLMVIAEAFVDGKLSRRDMITRMLGLGVAPAVAGSVLAMALQSNSVFAQQAAVPADVKGEVRFLIGPWTDKELEHQQVIATAFKKLFPNVEVTFKLFNWETGGTEVRTSLISEAHDIYYFDEGGYLGYASPDTSAPMADITSRVNDPAWASEKAKYLFWDRIAAYGPKIIALPVCWNPESVLFVNMEMVRAAGFDETFAENLDTFNACVKAMTKGTDTYGLGIGIQNFCEWYQRARAAGGRYLTEDVSGAAINTPEVIAITDAMAGYFRDGIAPALNTYDYNTAPDAFIGGKLAIYSADTSIGAVITSKPKPPAFEWIMTPWPPAQQSRACFNDLGFYAIGPKTKNMDLAWEALKFWTNGPSAAYWAGVSGPYPARTDAAENKYDSYAPKELLAAFDSCHNASIGPEPYLAWGTVESGAEPQIAKVFAGQQSAEDAIKNIDKIIQQEMD